MVARAGPRPGEEHPTVAAPARGARGRGSSPVPSAHGPGGGHRGSRERPTRREPPSLLPKKRVGFRPKRLHAGSGTAWRGGGGQNTSLLVTEFGVCHLSFLTWPSACAPALPREGAARRGGGVI